MCKGTKVLTDTHVTVSGEEPDPQTYVVDAIIGFLNDPPSTEYQHGYESALRTVYLDVWGTPKMRGMDARGELDWNELMRSTS